MLVLALLGGYVGLILLPNGTAALRLGGVSLLWWYGGVVAPVLGVIGLVASRRGGDEGRDWGPGARGADGENPSAGVEA